MKIVFTKDKRDGEAHSLRIERSDGTTDWMPSTPFFVEHDITHYAVETTFGLQSGFWGLVRQGRNFSSFEDRQPGSRKVVQLPKEAYLSEGLVGVFQIDHRNGPFCFEELVRIMAESFESLGMLPPTLTQENARAVRELKNRLLGQWATLTPGDSLLLTFEIQPGD